MKYLFEDLKEYKRCFIHEYITKKERSKNMFNIYYINYAKAYEISMLIDNKILESKIKEKDSSVDGNVGAGVNLTSLATAPFIGKYMPKLDVDGSVTGTKSSKVIDTVKVITTKSTILDRIYSKAKEVSKLQDKAIGNLIKIRNVSLKVKNENDILGVKTLLSGAIKDIAVEGVGNVDFSSFLEAIFKDSAYILEGVLPKEKFKKAERVVIKIPMQAENEMENQYSISDLEIGKVTLVGIYRGRYDGKELYAKLNRFLEKSEDETMSAQEAGIVSDDDTEEEKLTTVHYIDIIAVVQDINF